MKVVLPVFLLKLDVLFFFCFLLFFAHQSFPGEMKSQKTFALSFHFATTNQTPQIPLSSESGWMQNVLVCKLYLGLSHCIVCFNMLGLPCCSRPLSVTVFFKVSLCCWKLFPEKEESKRETELLFNTTYRHTNQGYFPF